eukprot:g1097.t1
MSKASIDIPAEVFIDLVRSLLLMSGIGGGPTTDTNTSSSVQQGTATKSESVVFRLRKRRNTAMFLIDVYKNATLHKKLQYILIIAHELGQSQQRSVNHDSHGKSKKNDKEPWSHRYYRWLFGSKSSSSSSSKDSKSKPSINAVPRYLRDTERFFVIVSSVPRGAEFVLNFRGDVLYFLRKAKHLARKKKNASQAHEDNSFISTVLLEENKALSALDNRLQLLLSTQQTIVFRSIDLFATLSQRVFPQNSYKNHPLAIRLRDRDTLEAKVEMSIVRYMIGKEAVHEFRSWDDVQNRICGDGRLCYGLFHASIPTKPLVFIEIALCSALPNNINAILQGEKGPTNKQSESEPDNQSGVSLQSDEQHLANYAVFYSVTNTFPGLRGFQLASFLIFLSIEKLIYNVEKRKRKQRERARRDETNVAIAKVTNHSNQMLESCPRRKRSRNEIGLTVTNSFEDQQRSSSSSLSHAGTQDLSLSSLLDFSFPPCPIVFATLSPVPGFRKWLEAALARRDKFIFNHYSSIKNNIGKHNNANTDCGDKQEKWSKAFAIIHDYVQSQLGQQPSSSNMDTGKEQVVVAGEGKRTTTGTEVTMMKNELDSLQWLLHRPHLWFISKQYTSALNERASHITALAYLLRRLCATYILFEKRSTNSRREQSPREQQPKQQKILDPVANFHIQNGARAERINFMGDPSAKGLEQSYGLMINYVYSLADLTRTASEYRQSSLVAASGLAATLLWDDQWRYVDLDVFGQQALHDENSPATIAPLRDIVGLGEKLFQQLQVSVRARLLLKGQVLVNSSSSDGVQGTLGTGDVTGNGNDPVANENDVEVLYFVSAGELCIDFEKKNQVNPVFVVKKASPESLKENINKDDTKGNVAGRVMPMTITSGIVLGHWQRRSSYRSKRYDNKDSRLPWNVVVTSERAHVFAVTRGEVRKALRREPALKEVLSMIN